MEVLSDLSVCVDVGGTFTDCLAQWKDADHRWQTGCLKVLSSGLIRCEVKAVDPGGNIVLAVPQELTVNLPGRKLPHQFFRDGTLYALEEDSRHRVGTVTEFGGDDEAIRIDGDPQTITPGSLVEIDCGLEAPVLATRLILGIPPHVGLPPVSVRLGTTRGTNALLTRGGVDTALVVTQGFGDVLEIGEQDRPELFDLAFQKPYPLTERIVEIDARMDAGGGELRPVDEPAVSAALEELESLGVQTVAVCLMHAHLNPEHERVVERLAREAGFAEVSRSSEVAPLIKLVARADTTTLDSYLNPILSSYAARVRRQFGGRNCDLRLMTSGGHLVESDRFRGRDSVLSGPAGGIVALGEIAKRWAEGRCAIGLDMGGTSTDVSRFDGVVNRRFETKIGGLRILAPMMDIHTVAAGGGSICDFVGSRLVVGPDSAGAMPGPACYGRGGPLTVTDVNLVLGRLLPERFPFPLNRSASIERLETVASRMPDPPELKELAEGFLDIAVTHMAEAVRAITTARGVDVRDHVLIGFGGAAAQHLCRIADALGVGEILDHPRASVLSAVGIGIAETGGFHTTGVYRRIEDITSEEFKQLTEALIAEAKAEIADRSTRLRIEYDCRYVGTDASIPLSVDSLEAIPGAFHTEHEKRFGYRREGQPIEWVSARCEITRSDTDRVEQLLTVSTQDASTSHFQETEVWSRGSTRSFQLVERQCLKPGDVIPGGTVVVSDQSTLIVEPNWAGEMFEDGTIALRPTEVDRQNKHRFDVEDPIQLEIVARRLQSIADSMGEVLRRTAVSVNVKERLDFSCAVFRGDGSLVASAPHVPVHLGAMGHTVRFLAAEYPEMHEGDCYLSNDPYSGGSHLPDITLVTPVFCSDSHSHTPDYFVASRAHHAEIGGLTPGSMPPAATCLAEEGVLIRAFALVRNGESHEAALRSLLTSGSYPSRNPDENLADLRAQIAAGREGASQIRRMTEELGNANVTAMMGKLLQVAAESVGRWIQTLPDESMCFEDQLDDGTAIAVRFERRGDRLLVDFDGTGAVHPRGFNATPSIVSAAVLYVLRSYCDSNFPLCDGALAYVDLNVPTGLLSPPPNDDPNQCAAVVAGNVETSQRLVDVLLGAIGNGSVFRAVAASQGTMNNVLMGDDSFGYYETIGGGCGATVFGRGASGVHTHMTNTRITDPEVVESRLPVRLHQFAIRRGSGGEGKNRGGDGMIREFEFLRELTVSVITGRRTTKPYGVAGGGSGESGRNVLIRKNGERTDLGYAATVAVSEGDRLRIETPGGGGWGEPSSGEST
ncbi:MAG: hydantoinase B/oxoprolinase family protein [Planctomycetota bacterium]